VIEYKKVIDASSDEVSDDTYESAVKVVTESGKASTSFLQRKLGIGYSRAAHLMDMLEDEEIIGPARGSKPREVLVEENTSN
jgi:S-DNA-T family DNA segregation ATPase FtsK/SpoIIIE